MIDALMSIWFPSWGVRQQDGPFLAGLYF